MYYASGVRDWSAAPWGPGNSVLQATTAYRAPKELFFKGGFQGCQAGGYWSSGLAMHHHLHCAAAACQQHRKQPDQGHGSKTGPAMWITDFNRELLPHRLQ